jgi:YidC/Oxa1 family membrane protein insertase
MMKYMMIFMGLIFYKVASGLCIYFIASSLWGLAERQFLPKHAPETSAPKTESRADAKSKARAQAAAAAKAKAKAAADRDGSAAKKKKSRKRR